MTMTKLQRFYNEQGQSPRLDNLTWWHLRDSIAQAVVLTGSGG